jgi:hypothetical protein
MNPRDLSLPPDWRSQYVCEQTIGARLLEYRIEPDQGSTKFLCSVNDGQLNLVLDPACETLQEAIQRCDEDLSDRRCVYHQQVIEDRTAAFLAQAGIKLKITSERSEGLTPPYPSIDVLREVAAYKASLQRNNTRLEFPVWGENMPTETIVLYMAGKLATSQVTYPQYCEQHGLDPAHPESLAIFKRIQDFEKQACKFFSPSEVHQLDRLNDPPQTKSLSGRSQEL